MADYSKLIKKVKNSIGIVLCLNPTDNKIIGKGSGFVFKSKGIFITCNHVVSDSNSVVKIRLCDSSEDFIDAKISLRDEEHDIAVLKYDVALANDIEPLQECNSDSIEEGMEVVFSGYPLSLFNLTTHQGIISAIIKDPTGINTYMIDGTVNSGNSGCPLMNDKGDVVGIVNAKRRESSDLLEKVEKMPSINAVSLFGLDLVDIKKALIQNVQLGMGYAIPCSYIPIHNDNTSDSNKSDNKTSN